MFWGRVCVFSTVAVSVLGLPSYGQSVISARSGVVHFFEGAVYLGAEPLEPHLGKFPSIAEGAELRTAQGRAEVLLTPAVFLRVGERSAIRMLANDLSDTRVELLAGSAIVDSGEPGAGTSVTLVYKDWNVRFPQRGVYRIDSEPSRLVVLTGKAQVSAGPSGPPVSVAQGMYVPFAPVLVPERQDGEPGDPLTAWAEGRKQSISADNAIAANIQDPASMDITSLGLDSFTYFPMLGLPSRLSGLSSPSYSWSGLYQPGFNSIYLPGYTYRPSFLGLSPGGYRKPLQSPIHIGVSPYSPPRTPNAHPTPAHPAPRVGVHGGVHR